MVEATLVWGMYTQVQVVAGGKLEKAANIFEKKGRLKRGVNSFECFFFLVVPTEVGFRTVFISSLLFSWVCVRVLVVWWIDPLLNLSENLLSRIII